MVNVNYKEQVGLLYGQYKLNFDNDFLSGEQTIGIIFEPTPLVKTLVPIGSATTNSSFIVPYLIYGQETNPKILYDGGAIEVEPYTIYSDFNSISSLNGVNAPTGQTTTFYNYAGHFDNPTNPTFDLNWNVNEFYYYDEVLDNLTENNLYNKYWSDYVNLISDSKLLTANFNLNEIDIANLNFARKIWIRDSYWLLNKVIDYNVTERGLTKVELIKSPDTIKFKPRRRIIRPREVYSKLQYTKPFQTSVSDLNSDNSNPGSTSNVNYGDMVNITGRDNIVQPGVKNSMINGSYNAINTAASNVNILGDGNLVGDNSTHVFVQGFNNSIGAGTANISIVNGQNNIILDGIVGTSITNASNIIVDSPGKTYINEFSYYIDGVLVNNSDIVDGGLDVVYEISPYYTENLNDAGLDNVYTIGRTGADMLDGVYDGTIINNQGNI